MKKLAVVAMVVASLVGFNASLALAWTCPKLVEDCNTLVSKVEKRAGADKAKLAEAKAGCEEALNLHKAGKHKESVIKAGEAITSAGQAGN